MSTPHLPVGYRTVSQYRIVRGADGTIEFLRKVFDAQPLWSFRPAEDRDDPPGGRREGEWAGGEEGSEEEGGVGSTEKVVQSKFLAAMHVMEHEADWARPRGWHPVFFGSYDWHSCVHGYWQLATLRRLFPDAADLPQREAIESRFDEALSDQNVRGEMAYFQRPASRGFERPYGWAWLLALADELSRHDDQRGRRWHAAVVPLAELIARRFVAFLAKAAYPIRAGTHANTAFAIALARPYAASHADAPLATALESAARRWYANDADCQAWEPSLDDFLSPALVEAMCMRTVLERAEFAAWLGRFLPRLGAGGGGEPRALFEPAVVTDRTDGKIVHLDGLNLSRAWCFRGIAGAVEDSSLRERLEDAAERHLSASLPHVAGDYMSEHWLASFALLALREGAEEPPGAPGTRLPVVPGGMYAGATCRSDAANPSP